MKDEEEDKELTVKQIQKTARMVTCSNQMTGNSDTQFWPLKFKVLTSLYKEGIKGVRMPSKASPAPRPLEVLEVVVLVEAVLPLAEL